MISWPVRGGPPCSTGFDSMRGTDARASAFSADDGDETGLLGSLPLT